MVTLYHVFMCMHHALLACSAILSSISVMCYKLPNAYQIHFTHIRVEKTF